MEGSPWQVKKTVWYPGHTWEHGFLPWAEGEGTEGVRSTQRSRTDRGCDLGQRDSANLLRVSESTEGLGSMHPGFTPLPLPSPVSYGDKKTPTPAHPYGSPSVAGSRGWGREERGPADTWTMLNMA